MSFTRFAYPSAVVNTGFVRPQAEEGGRIAAREAGKKRGISGRASLWRGKMCMASANNQSDVTPKIS